MSELRRQARGQVVVVTVWIEDCEGAIISTDIIDSIYMCYHAERNTYAVTATSTRLNLKFGLTPETTDKAETEAAFMRLKLQLCTNRLCRWDVWGEPEKPW